MFEMPLSRWVRGVAPAVPGHSEGWVVDGQDEESTELVDVWAMTLARAWAPSCHWLSEPGQESAFPASLKGLAVVPSRGPAPCWSPQALHPGRGLHAGPYCSGTMSAVLLSAPGTPSLVSSEKTLKEGWAG